MLFPNVHPDVLHLVQHVKFIPAYIQLVSRHLQPQRHHFFFVQGGEHYEPDGSVKITRGSDYQSRVAFSWSLAKSLNQAGKIVLHGLFSSHLIILLWLQPWLWKRCYWVIWGGDLYTYADRRGGWRWRIKELFRKPLIRHFGHLVTYIPGDVLLAQKWYGATGSYHECLSYPSNLFYGGDIPPRGGGGVNVLLGNSADRSNEHFEAYLMLEKFRDKNIHIYAPLSYGDHRYAQEVAAQGRMLFGSKFTPLLDFLPLEEYSKLLAKIDVAVFNHRRQQAMGNTTTLLGMGKKVFMRRDVTPWNFYVDLGVTIFDVREFNLEPLERSKAFANHRRVAEYFTEDRLVEQWKKILL